MAGQAGSGGAAAGVVSVVSYARISQDRAEDAHGVASQHRANRAAAGVLGWRVVFEFTDNDLSAADPRVVRPEFEAMLRVLARGRLADGTPVGGVVVVEESRLYRSGADYERFVDALTARPGAVFSVGTRVIDLANPGNEVAGVLMAALGRQEVRRTKERLRRWAKDRAVQGLVPPGRRPFGWAADRLAVHPVEGPLLAGAVREVAAGRSMNSIVAAWRRAGVQTAGGREWSVASLRAALKSPRLCGLRVIGGTELVRDEHGEVVVGRWEPLVSVEEWEACQAVFRARAGHLVSADGTIGALIAPDARETRALGTGILRCGNMRPDGTLCNAPLRSQRNYSRPAAGHRYACRDGNAGGCGGVSRSGPEVDRVLTDLVLAKVEADTAAAVEVGRDWPGAADLASVEGRAGELRRRWLGGQIGDESFYPLLAGLEKQARDLRAGRDRHAATVRRAGGDAARLRERWNTPPEDGGLDMAQKRAMVKGAVHAVIVRPAGRGRRRFDPSLLEFRWRQA